MTSEDPAATCSYSASDLAALRATYSSLTRYLLAVLTGAIVFFPTILGTIRRPYVADGLAYGFWVLSVLGLCCCTFAHYISTFTKAGVPHRSAGLGHFFTLGAILCLILYVALNFRNDQSTPPRITAITVTPKVAAPNDWVLLTADATDIDRENLTWTWSVLPRGDESAANGIKRMVPPDVLAGRPSTYWRVPAEAKPREDYVIEVTARNDAGISTTGSVTVTVKDGP